MSLCATTVLRLNHCSGGGGQDARVVASDASHRQHHRRRFARPGGQVFQGRDHCRKRFDGCVRWYWERMSASLIGRLGSRTFRLSNTAVSMSLTGSRFSSESAPRPFHHDFSNFCARNRQFEARHTSVGNKLSCLIKPNIVGLASLVCCHLFFSLAQRCFPSPASALLTSY
jgi:hypothetical protein